MSIFRIVVVLAVCLFGAYSSFSETKRLGDYVVWLKTTKPEAIYKVGDKAEFEIKIFKDANKNVVEFSGIMPNPTAAKVKEGIKLVKENNVDFILAVGGGSTIDSSKAIAAGVCCKEDIWAYYLNENKQIEGALPVGVVLTIPAAGSESSDSSVITNEEENYKRYIGSEYLTPKFALMNPEVTFSMPANQIANGGSDIVAHLMERYFTTVKHVDFTDRLIEGAIRTILYHGPMALAHPTDYDIRAEIMWTGTVAHNNLLNMGRIGDWASHDIEHELSAQYDIAHGAGLSIVFPAWMKYVYKTDSDKFVQFAVRVFDVSLAFDDKEQIVFEMIDRLESWYRKKMGLPTRLSDVGIGARLLSAALSGAFLNVMINARDMQDRKQAELLLSRGEAWLAQGEEIAHKVYEAVRRELQS